MHKLAQFDHQYVWHPFTQMKDWLKKEPIIIRRGKGSLLYDVYGREFIDANSSIWTNLHGHNHPALNRALKSQAGKIAHSSALGLANEPASILAEQLVKAWRWPRRASPFLTKVFFSDDGSTAMEVALKLAYEYARRNGQKHPRFLSLGGAYHGDTIGAVSLGHIDLFHSAYKGLLFKTDKVPSPYCYRCPHNKAEPERRDARLWRKCNFECVSAVERKFHMASKAKKPFSAFCIEPLMQGAAGMIAQPEGYFKQVADLTRQHGALLICDEVMTGFGRCSVPAPGKSPSLFASQSENVLPDFVALAKGLTGGYLPMAATLTTNSVFDAFLGEYSEFKTFFHGHSYTANQLGAALGIASLELLQLPEGARDRLRLRNNMAKALDPLWQLPWVGDIRQVGLVAGIELVKNWHRRTPFALEERVGIRICELLAQKGILTRPIGSVIVIMPPYSTTANQMARIGTALYEAIEETLSNP